MAKYSKNYNLVLPEPQDYYDVAVFNENFKSVDEIMAATGNDRVVVASFDTNSQRKRVADYICDANNAVQVLEQAIKSLNSGGELFLMEGTYYINSCLRIDKSVVVRGRGCHFTKLIKTEGTEALLNICADAVLLEGLMLADNYDNMTGLRDIVLIGKDNAILRDVFFVQKGQQLSQSSIIRLVADSRYTRIDNCRFFREYSLNERCMLNLSKFSFSGCINGNILSGNDNFSVNFKDRESYDNTVLCGNYKTEIYINSVPAE